MSTDPDWYQLASTVHWDVVPQTAHVSSACVKVVMRYRPDLEM